MTTARFQVISAARATHLPVSPAPDRFGIVVNLNNKRAQDWTGPSSK